MIIPSYKSAKISFNLNLKFLLIKHFPIQIFFFTIFYSENFRQVTHLNYIRVHMTEKLVTEEDNEQFWQFIIYSNRGLTLDTILK